MFPAVRAVCGLPVTVLSYVADPVTVHAQYIYVSILLELSSAFFSVNLAMSNDVFYVLGHF